MLRAEVVLVAAAAVCLADAAYNMDLVTLLKNQHQAGNRLPGAKRKFDGNPCNEPEKPFPCRGTSTCIPMGYVCDDNWDCEDGYDEDLEVCTAVHRPPVEDIMRFLLSEKAWIMPQLFANKGVKDVAHGLAVSPTVDDFKRRLGFNNRTIKKLRLALEAVREDNKELWEGQFKMPPSAWTEVVFIFSKLIKSGFM